MQAIRYRLLASLLTMALTMALSGAAQGQAASPDERAREIEQQMTDEERFSLFVSLIGAVPSIGVPRDNRIPEGVNMSAGYTPGIPRLGVPALQSSDASMGVTNPGYRPDDKGATAFPASIVVGASFNPKLARDGGAAIAREAQMRGFNIMLAGGINLARDVRNGRNFEYYSEDPLVSAVLGAEAVYAVGIDKWGPAPQVDMAKHNEIALETARQGIVLLKNDGMLPLATDKPLKVAVIGGYAQEGVASGTGSGAVLPVGGFAAIIKIGGPGTMGAARNLYLFPSSPLVALKKLLPDAQFEFDRPQGLTAVIDRLPAVLTAYFGGPHQGTAVADTLFGVTNPAGKLPVTIPRHVGQVPIYHEQKTGSGYRRTKADIHKGYLDMPSTPLFPFGHGLSYTTFEYGPLKLESDTVDVSGELRLSLTVTNTGKRRGTEVVQLYAADTATGVTLPAQQLVGFARLDLEPGASKTVSFVVPMSLLAYTGLSGELVMEPGTVEVSVGSSSSDIRSTANFTVTGNTRAIKGEDRAFLSVATVGSSGTRERPRAH
jgi:hypothetical protein